MNNEKYNGWTNYETWAIGLWIDNEQSSYTYWREQAGQCFEDAADDDPARDSIKTRQLDATSALAERLREAFEEEAPLEDQATVYSDLLSAALERVDWHEISSGLLAEVIDEEERKSVEEPAPTVIYSYTRSRAIEDGVLVDVTEMAKEAGFKYPVALTAAVWGDYVRVPEGVECQDEKGRLWDILNMLCFAIRNDGSESEVSFSLYVNNSGKPEPVYLKSVCGPGDDAEPVITIMLPHED